MRLLLLLFVLTLGGCAAAGGAGGGAGSSRDVLTRAELSGYEVMTVWDVIERQRPEWLRSRGRVSVNRQGAALPVVYLDNSRYGDLESLRSLRAGDAAEIRRLSGPEATQLYGTGLPGGVIHVMTR